MQQIVGKLNGLVRFLFANHFSAQGIFWDTRKTRVVHVPLDCIEVPRHQEINLNYVEKSFAKEDDKEEPIP